MAGKTRPGKRMGFVAIVLMATALCFAGQPAGASGDTGGRMASPAVGPGADELARQERMFSVFDPFYRELSQSEWGAGFAQAKASDGIRSLTIYWRGHVPRQAREFAANDVFPVEIKPAKYSEIDLAGLARSINKHWDARWGTYLGLRPEAGSNSFAVSWAPRPGADPKGVATGLKRSVPGIGESVQVRATVSPVQTAAWRWNDSSPWNSGGGLALGDGGPEDVQCTLGPAVLVNGTERFLTAGHCGSHTFVDGTGATIGSTTFVSSIHDYQFIAANASGKVFVGAWNNYAGPTRNIEYVGGNAIGSWVCNEGANSGEHCSLRVSDYSLDANGWTLWEAWNPFDIDEVVNVGGDSGAPIISPGATEATVRGLNVAYLTSHSESCSGVPMRRTVTNCGSEIQYYSLSQILTHHGASLITY